MSVEIDDVSTFINFIDTIYDSRSCISVNFSKLILLKIYIDEKSAECYINLFNKFNHEVEDFDFNEIVLGSTVEAYDKINFLRNIVNTYDAPVKFNRKIFFSYNRNSNPEEIEVSFYKQEKYETKFAYYEKESSEYKGRAKFLTKSGDLKYMHYTQADLMTEKEKDEILSKLNRYRSSKDRIQVTKYSED